MSTLVPFEDDSQVIQAGLDAALSDVPEDPYLRAGTRLTQLKASFAATLGLVMKMYVDEDWRYLSREDGSPYSSLTEVIEDHIDVSASMARRYVQGATEFFMPLSGITIEGTLIEIKSGDVASLGNRGMADAVSIATTNLEGVEDPEQSSEIIQSAIGEAKSNRAPRDDDLGLVDDDFDNTPLPGINEGPRGGGGEGDLVDDLPEPGVSDDWEEDGPYSAPPSFEDALSAVLEDATDYADPDALNTLSEPLRGVCAALVTLSQIDPSEIARMIDYEGRGVLTPISDAIENATTLSVLVQTTPWFVAQAATS